MRSAVLDLDNPLTHAGKLKQIVYGEDTWAVLSGKNKGSFDAQEIYAKPERLKDPFIKHLRDQCDEALREDFTHVAVYHACRCKDQGKYHEKGILTSSPERLEAKAREIFAWLPNLGAVLTRHRSYFEMYGGGVNVYTTAKYAPPDYLDGSHYLRMVAHSLGPEAVNRIQREYEKACPVFVRCEIPLPWLEDRAWTKEPYLYLYSTRLMDWLIHTRTKGTGNYLQTPAALLIRQAIPPECVESMLPADVCLAWRQKEPTRGWRDHLL